MRGRTSSRAPWPALLALIGALICPRAGAGAADLQPAAKKPALREAAPPADCPAPHEVCLRSEERGEFDLRTGTADLSGNVRGYSRRQRMRFASQRARAQREGKQAWRRIELTGAVRMTQPGRRIASDHAVIEPAAATAYGKVRLDGDRLWGEGDELTVEQEPRRVTLKGTPAHPLTLFVSDTSAQAGAQADAAAEEGAEAPAAPNAAPPPGARPESGTRAQADRAVFEERSRQLVLTGAVHVFMSARSLDITAASVTVQFNEEHQVQAFQARGDAVITQPGRRLLGDSARTQNQMRTILLQGKAHVQQEGQFDLSSERLEVFTDAKRGVVRSEDRQRPLSLSLDVRPRTSWRLDAGRLSRLRKLGMPEGVLAKLEPMADLAYPNQAEFQQAVKQRLTDEESERYMPDIVAQAKP